MRLLSFLITCISCVIISTDSYAYPVEPIHVYQKNVHLSPEHKQKLEDDIDRFHHADNIWAALRDDFTLPHYEDNPEVRAQIHWFMSHQGFLYRSAVRAAPYLYYISQELKRRHLPGELALLPMIESGYNPFAYSTVGAAGVWQMMPGTASGYGVKQNWWYDGRRDVIASTKAALNYLSYLGSFFNGNWLLAIAAYDTGEGNVMSALRKNIHYGFNTDFWSLPVAQETREYVPRLLALATIIAHPYRYPVVFPFVRNAPYLAQVDVGGQIDLKHAAFLAGISVNDLMALNSGFNRTATDPNGPYRLTLPIENVVTFSENLARLPTYQHLDWVRYKVKRRESLVAIARKFNTTPGEIYKQNPTVAMNLKPGKYLLIPKAMSSVSKPITRPSRSFFATSRIVRTPKQTHIHIPTNEAYVLQPGDTLYMVRSGETLPHIASRFRMDTKALQIANQLASASAIKPGQQLIIPTHLTNHHHPEGTHSISPGDTIYIVRKNDSIESIAKRYHTFPSAIRLSNFMANNHIKEGDHLVIPTHLSG